MPQLFVNNLATTTSSYITDSQTSIPLPSGFSSLFWPLSAVFGDYTLATIDDGTNIEVVKVTGRSFDSVIVTRAQEGTTARAWNGGAKFEARITAGTLRGLLPGSEAATRRIAIGGGSATADYATAIGEAKVRGEIAFGSGYGARVYSPKSWGLRGFPVIPRDDANFGSEDASYMTGCEAAFSSSFVDLGNVPLWAASTTYTDGDVVRPTTGGDNQFHLWVDGFPATKTAVSSSTQPTWDTDPYGWTRNATGENNWWLTVNPTTGFQLDIPDGMRFFPTEVGFLCFKHSATAAPYVSVGTYADQAKLVNNQQMTAITGAHMWHRFTSLPAVGIDDNLHFKVVTKATGTNSQFHGKFYAKGIFINTQDLA